MSLGGRSRSSQNDAELAISRGPALETAAQCVSKRGEGWENLADRRVERAGGDSPDGLSESRGSGRRSGHEGGQRSFTHQASQGAQGVQDIRQEEQGFGAKYILGLF